MRADAFHLGIPVARVEERLASGDMPSGFVKDGEIELRLVDRAFARVPVRQAVELGQFVPPLERIDLQQPFSVKVRMFPHVDDPVPWRQGHVAVPHFAQDVLLCDGRNAFSHEAGFAQGLPHAGLVLVDLDGQGAPAGPVGQCPFQDLVIQKIVSAGDKDCKIAAAVFRHDKPRQRSERVEPQMGVVAQKTGDVLFFRPDPVLPVSKAAQRPDEPPPVAVVLDEECPHALVVVAPVLVRPMYRFHQSILLRPVAVRPLLLA